ncbi:MAG: F0F1 ATP synthase subunit A [Chitinophagaceae bacterium]
MRLKRLKGLLVAAFSLMILQFSFVAQGQEIEHADRHLNNEGAEAIKKESKPLFDANEVIFGHVMDAHQFHFFSYKGSDGLDHHATIPLPVILYSPQKGLSLFSSSNFHHGEHTYNGYQLVTEHYREELKSKGVPEEAIKNLKNENIIAVDEAGLPVPEVKVYDFSFTRNVVQMFIALGILLWLMTSIGKRYKNGYGITSAPKGWQNAIEPVVAFVRDEVAKPNIGRHYVKYTPFLLTIFFFILINNLVGLIPGTANVTGNIAFTLVLGLISFVVINVSANKHYWGHIVNPPVPLGIKFIMVPVEILSIVTKPFSLIIRLFANMLAGHIIIICLISLIFILGGLSRGIGWGFSPISVAFTVFIYFIEILVAFIQAFIFAYLTAVFIGQATEESHHISDNDHAPTEPVII